MLMITFIYNWNSYASNQPLLLDISNTYKQLSTTQRYEDRISLIGQLVQRSIRIQRQLFSKSERSENDMVTIVQITALTDLYNELKDQATSSSCIDQFNKNAYRLYPGPMENLKDLPNFEKSLYNLYGKMCSTSFKVL